MIENEIANSIPIENSQPNLGLEIPAVVSLSSRSLRLDQLHIIALRVSLIPSVYDM